MTFSVEKYKREISAAIAFALLLFAVAIIVSGIAAVSLYWLHIAPEAVMLLVALPALILFVCFITLTKLSMPNNKEIAAMQKHAHERAVQTDALVEDILKRYPDQTAPESETDTP